MSRVELIIVLSASFLAACFLSTTEESLACTELRPGSRVTADVGGSAASGVELGALMEFAGVAATTSLELTARCAEIASELGTPQAAIDAAFTPTSVDARVTAMCKLATDALARGHDPIALTTVTCKPAPLLSCATSCVPAAQACNDACNAAAAAKADCPEPPGVALHFAPILAMRARLAIMSASANALTAGIDAIDDIKAVCIPYARDRVRDANAHVAASQKAIDALLIAAGGP